MRTITLLAIAVQHNGHRGPPAEGDDNYVHNPVTTSGCPIPIQLCENAFVQTDYRRSLFQQAMLKVCVLVRAANGEQ